MTKNSFGVEVIFKVSVMTEKSIFVSKLFLSINI